jgi:hypothetical protein
VINPWLIVGMLVAVMSAFFYGREVGEDSANAAWAAREVVQLAAMNKKIQDLQTAARDKEQVHAMAVNLLSATYEGERNALKVETTRLRAAVRSGELRLRDRHAAREQSCGSPSGETGTAASQRDGGAGAYLSAEASEFLLELTGEADEVVRQLTACQQVLVEDRK